MKNKKIILGIATLIFSFFIFLPISSADWLEGIDFARESALPGSSSDIYVEDVISTILLWLLYIFTFLSVIAFVVGGIMFLMAGSDAGAAERAKGMVKYSIIGIAIGLSGYIILNFADELLSGTIV